MTTPSPRRCPWFPLLVSLAAAFVIPTGVQSADATGAFTPADAGPGAGIELFLEVTLNGVRTGKVANFIVRDGAWWTHRDTLRGLGLRWPGPEDGETLVPLARLEGLQMTYHAADQRITLLADVALLDRPDQVLPGSGPASIEPDAVLPSFVVLYDVYGQRMQGASSGYTLSAWNEARLSGVGPGAWEATAISRAVELPGFASRETLRLDTQWQYDLPRTMVSVSAGDATTGALAWTRSTRIGGLRLARNFGLQPYLSTAPSALVRGEAVLPSTVDLYINGVRQASRPVQPGAFSIEGTPMLTGAGQARLVITDINGRQRVVDFPLYGTPQLLRAGLLDGSVEVGAVREDYGLRSFSYGRLMASGTGRYGLTDDVTLEGHAQADSRVAMAGAGGTWLLPAQAGAISLAAAASRAEGQRGRQASLGYQWGGGAWSLAVGSLRRDSGFRDVASNYDAELPRATDQAFAGMNSRWGSLGAGYVRQAYPRRPPSRLATLTWTTGLPGTSSLTLNLLRDLQGRTSTIALTLHVPLQGQVSVGGGVRRSAGRSQATIAARSSTPADVPGWGWRAEAAAGEQRSALAEVSRLGPHGRWSAGIQHDDSGVVRASTTLFSAASGAVLWTQGDAFALPRVDDAFAMVSTDGIAGVPVLVENRVAGETDANGTLLLRGLRPYERNRLSIDPLKLDPDMRMESVQEEVVPPGRAGVRARFALRRVLALQAMLQDATGTPLPAGSRAWLEAPGAERRPLVVGYEGLVYVEDAPAGARLVVESDPPCAAPLPALAGKTGQLDAGILVCRPWAATERAR